MALFSTQDTLPAQEQYIPPKYGGNWFTSLLGYNKQGKMNTWGKISHGLFPFLGMGANAVDSQINKSNNWKDTQVNVDASKSYDAAAGKLLLDAGSTALNFVAPGAGTVTKSLGDAGINAYQGPPPASTAVATSTNPNVPAVGNILTAPTDEEEIDPVTGLPKKKDTQGYQKYQGYYRGGTLRKYSAGGDFEGLGSKNYKVSQALSNSAASGGASAGSGLDFSSIAKGAADTITDAVNFATLKIPYVQGGKKITTRNYKDGGDMNYVPYMKHSIGRKRDQMPQIDSDTLTDFIIHFADKTDVKKVELAIKTLKPSQDEINEDKVKKMMDDPEMDDSNNRYIVSSDNYILDGHHRWAKDLQQDPSKRVMCYKIDMPIRDLLSRANKLKMTTKRDINDKDNKEEAPDTDKEKAELNFANGGPTPAKAAIMLHDGTIRGRKITDKQRRYFGAIASQKASDGLNFKMYADGDKTEDVEMIDKGTGEKVGEMRYGERIFSQKQNAVIEELADAGMTFELGKYVQATLEKHEQNESEQERKAEGEPKARYGMKLFARGGFFGGGKGRDNSQGPLDFGDGQYSNYRNLYYKRYGTYDSKPYYDELNKRYGYNAALPLYGHDNTFRAEHASRWAQLTSDFPDVNQPSEDLSGQPSKLPNPDGYSPDYKVLYGGGSGDGSGNGNGADDNGFNFGPQFTGKGAGNTKGSLKGKLGMSDYFGIGKDVVGAIEGLNIANQDMPVWQVPENWTNLVQREQDLSFQGLTPQEKEAYTKSADDTFALTANALTQSGAIGNQGAVLAGLSAAGQGRQDEIRKMFAADASTRRSNLSQYASIIPQDVAYDRLKFGDEMSAYLPSVAAGAQLENSALQNINDRIDFSKAYGEGSSYDNAAKLALENAELQNLRLKQSFINAGTHPSQAQAIVDAANPPAQPTQDIPTEDVSLLIPDTSTKVKNKEIVLAGDKPYETQARRMQRLLKAQNN